MAFVLIAAGAGIITFSAFVGTSVSNWLFSDKKVEAPQNNEIKSEIRVMSNEIKSINVVETIGLVTLIALATILAAYFIVKIIKSKSEPKVIFKNAEIDVESNNDTQESS